MFGGSLKNMLAIMAEFMTHKKITPWLCMAYNIFISDGVSVVASSVIHGISQRILYLLMHRFLVDLCPLSKQ